MRTSFPAAILLICGVLVIGVLGFLFFWKPSPNIPGNTNALGGTFADPRLHLDLNRSAPDHPVYVSDTYGFEYAPIGTFTESIGTPTGTEVFAAGILPATGTGGIGIALYPSSPNLSGTDLRSFRAWRTANLYDDPSDPIARVKVGQYYLLKATQANGIDSKGDYYYLLRENYVFVFPFAERTPIETVAASLAPLTLTGTAYLIPTQYDSTMTLDELGAKHLTGSEAETLITQVEDVNRWKTGTTDILGDTSCGTGPKHDQLVAFNAGERRSINLNNGFLITATPNTYHWTNLQAFFSDSPGDAVVCGVGTTVPHVIQGGWILWWNQCVGGMQPDPSLPGYQHTVRCLQAQEVVEQHYSL